jgi:precorrin-6Y C5,15-methyltransferase (decarboxylating) CbiT subunit
MPQNLWPFQTPGIPDQTFERIPGIPLSPREVRVLILSQMRLRRTDCLWDIGAGTGTISVEAGLICHEGQVLAVERDDEVVDLIQRNCKKFGLTNVQAIQGTAPDCLQTLNPAPDRICLEGGEPLALILEHSWQHLKVGGRLVATATSLESLYILSSALAAVRARQVEVTQSVVNRLEQRGRGQRFVALDPVFVLSGEKLD